MYSEKGKELILIDRFKFRFHKNLTNDLQRWVCTTKTCTAYIRRDSSGKITEDKAVHNHEPNTEHKLARERISNGVKRKAISEISDRPQKLLRKELDASALELLTEEDRTCIHQNLYRAWRSVYPALPRSLQELHEALESLESRTKVGEDFLLVNSEEENIVIVSTKTNIKYLQECRTILMDGTFYACPSLFKQIFVVHGMKKQKTVRSPCFLSSPR